MKKSKLTVLVPSLLDNHFPLLQYAFTSKDYDIVMLQNDGKNLQYLGLQYTHNVLSSTFDSRSNARYSTK